MEGCSNDERKWCVNLNINGDPIYVLYDTEQFEKLNSHLDKLHFLIKGLCEETFHEHHIELRDYSTKLCGPLFEGKFIDETVDLKTLRKRFFQDCMVSEVVVKSTQFDVRMRGKIGPKSLDAENSTILTNAMYLCLIERIPFRVFSYEYEMC